MGAHPDEVVLRLQAVDAGSQRRWHFVERLLEVGEAGLAVVVLDHVDAVQDGVPAGDRPVAAVGMPEPGE